jgi:hypothetical protein
MQYTEDVQYDDQTQRYAENPEDQSSTHSLLLYFPYGRSSVWQTPRPPIALLSDSVDGTVSTTIAPLARTRSDQRVDEDAAILREPQRG